MDQTIFSLALFWFILEITQGAINPNYGENEAYTGMVGVDYESIIPLARDGLPRTTDGKRAIIVGAGMSGLVAADLLKSAGHKVTVLEAESDIGGMVQTYRDPLGWYADLGAMNIFTDDVLMLTYIARFNIPIKPSIYHNPNAYYYFNGIKVRMSEAEKNISILNFGNLTSIEEEIVENQGIYGLAAKAFGPTVLQDFNKHGWTYVVNHYDQYSITEYLHKYLSPGAVNMLLTMTAFKGHYSILEFFRIMNRKINVNMMNDPTHIRQDFVNGADQLTLAFLPLLHDNILLRSKVVGIKQDSKGVTVNYANLESDQVESVSGDFVIVATTPTAAKEIQYKPALSGSKQKALNIGYSASTKIYLYFSEAFWFKEGIYGGRTLTDSPLMAVYYPNYNMSNGDGVLLASYTQWYDTGFWDAYSDEEAIQIALHELSVIHDRDLRDIYVNGIVSRWSDAFTMFRPTQEKELFPALEQSEGLIYFAGEYTCHMHRWMEAAVASGLRAVQQALHMRV